MEQHSQEQRALLAPSKEEPRLQESPPLAWEARPSSLCDTWRIYWPAVIVGVFALLRHSSLYMVLPILPVLKKDYFGNDHKAALVESIFDCGSALIGLLIAGLYGKVMDAAGRRPFFILAALTHLIYLLLIHFWPDVPLLYMVWALVVKIFQLSYQIAYIADRTAPKYRALAFGISEALGGLGPVGSLLVTVLPNHTVTTVAFSVAFASALWALFFAKESLPSHRRRPITCASLESPLVSVKYLTKSRVVLACVGIFCFFVLAQIGSSQLLYFYLDSHFAFNKDQNAYFQLISCAFSTLTFFLVAPVLLRGLKLRPVSVIIIGAVVLVVELAVAALATSVWQLYEFSAPAMGISKLVIPCTLLLLTTHGGERDQGRRVAGLVAVIDFFSAVGPMLFGLIYGNVHGHWDVAPFILCALFAVPLIVLAVKVHQWSELETNKRQLDCDHIDALHGEAPAESDPVIACVGTRTSSSAMRYPTDTAPSEDDDVNTGNAGEADSQ